MNTLASRLKYARELRGLKQDALAKLARVSQGTIGNIEAGIRGGQNSRADIAAALGVRYWWLRDGDGEMVDQAQHVAGFTPELLQAMSAAGKDVRWLENLARSALEMAALPRGTQESADRAA